MLKEAMIQYASQSKLEVSRILKESTKKRAQQAWTSIVHIYIWRSEQSSAAERLEATIQRWSTLSIWYDDLHKSIIAILHKETSNPKTRSRKSFESENISASSLALLISNFKVLCVSDSKSSYPNEHYKGHAVLKWSSFKIWKGRLKIVIHWSSYFRNNESRFGHLWIKNPSISFQSKSPPSNQTKQSPTFSVNCREMSLDSSGFS